MWLSQMLSPLNFYFLVNNFFWPVIVGATSIRMSASYNFQGQGKLRRIRHQAIRQDGIQVNYSFHIGPLVNDVTQICLNLTPLPRLFWQPCSSTHAFPLARENNKQILFPLGILFLTKKYPFVLWRFCKFANFKLL